MKISKTRALIVLMSAFPAGIAAAQPQIADSADTIVVTVPSAPERIAVPEEDAGLTDTEKLALADSLHNACQFRRAMQLCGRIISESPDSLVRTYAEELLSNARAGLEMSSAVSVPTVIARQKFTLRDFFLYYPFPDRSWRSLASCEGLRDSIQTVRAAESLGMLPDIAYFQEDDDVIYFSSPDTLGNMKIHVCRKDSLWSRPQMVFAPDAPLSAPSDSASAHADTMTANAGTTTAHAGQAVTRPLSEEIFPVLSADRRSLYFSARMKGGAGGFDIYESQWSEADSCWTEPVNLGFPYSSTENDYLYMNTDDGCYTVFASDRGCTRDSVCVYVLEYEFAPERQRITDAEKLRGIMALAPSDGTDVVDAGPAVGGGIPENEETRLYMEKMEDVRRIRDSLDVTDRHLEEMREEFTFSDDVERRQELTSLILEVETEIPKIQAELDRAASEVQKIEMEFLFSGVVIDRSALSSEASRNIVGDSSRYVFKEHRTGAPLHLRFSAPADSLHTPAAGLPDSPQISE